MIDTYLSALRSELGRLGVSDERGFEEVRDHLLDAVEAGVKQGLSREEAEREAVRRMGEPLSLARELAADRFVVLHDRPRRSLAEPIAVFASVLFGLAIAYMDSRPHWDDAGITAFSMLGVALLLGALAPRRPWLLALGIGVWIPFHALVRSRTPAAFVMFVVLAFPMAGGYAGAAARRVIASMQRS